MSDALKHDVQILHPRFGGSGKSYTGNLRYAAEENALIAVFLSFLHLVSC